MNTGNMRGHFSAYGHRKGSGGVLRTGALLAALLLSLLLLFPVAVRAEAEDAYIPLDITKEPGFKELWSYAKTHGESEGGVDEEDGSLYEFRSLDLEADETDAHYLVLMFRWYVDNEWTSSLSIQYIFDNANRMGTLIFDDVGNIFFEAYLSADDLTIRSVDPIPWTEVTKDRKYTGLSFVKEVEGNWEDAPATATMEKLANEIIAETLKVLYVRLPKDTGVSLADLGLVNYPTPKPTATPNPTKKPTATPKPTPKPTTKPTAAPGTGGSGKTADKVQMYRLYNPNSGEHFYTANTAEKNYLSSIGWNYEGIGWTAPESSKTPVYRLYNPNAGDHHYTMNPDEKNMLVAVGWNYEGIGWYSDDGKGVPLYRQYNPNAVAGSHNYTTSKAENDYLASIGWRAEGIGWYGVK